MASDFGGQFNLSDEFIYRSSSSLLHASAKYPHPYSTRARALDIQGDEEEEDTRHIPHIH